MKGCNSKFIYHSEEYGALVLRCGRWKKVKNIGNHMMQKFCYDCLDELYEKYLKFEKEKISPFDISFGADDLEEDAIQT